MKLAIAQLNLVVGAFEQNAKQILEAYEKGITEKVDLVLTPELSTLGYPPQDLVERRADVLEKTNRVLEDLKKKTTPHDTGLLVGHVQATKDLSAPAYDGLGVRPIQNAISVFEKGALKFNQTKTLLPTYDIFDELRLFAPGDGVKSISFKGTDLGFAICEDLWGEEKDLPSLSRLQTLSALISISASPYEWKKHEHRETIHSKIAQKLKTPLVFVNQISATDEILFDGRSFVCDEAGKVIFRSKAFEPSFDVVDLAQLRNLTCEKDPSEIQTLKQALIFGIREYFKRTGFKKAILGLSGGIDSAVVAALAVQALGRENVMGVAMPGPYSTSHSLEDAEALAKNLGISLEVRPIKFMYATFARELSPKDPVALENLQARLRGMLLMTLANDRGALVLTTGNKSEIAMGYCTLYGDMAGALAPIGDVYKTRVYELARELNSLQPPAIPERSITKAPSAELKPNQTDQDTLPPYENLDEVLALSLEKKTDAHELMKTHPIAKEVLKKLDQNEYKRKQAAPVLRVSEKAFGIGRRIPIAKQWQL